jgi:hypothetical protein
MITTLSVSRHDRANGPAEGATTLSVRAAPFTFIPA